MGLFRSRPQVDHETRPTPEDRLASLGPGVPGRCPRCDGLGYIDSIDIGHRFQIQHCKDCAHRWEYLFDAEGAVVGLTELDGSGQPLTRTRVRTRPLVDAPRPAPTLPTTPKLPADPAPADDVLDLRDPAPAEPAADDEDVAPAGHMSPAEWLRHSLRR
jgi:hypothetical protein